MERSKIGYQKWAIGVYLWTTSLKGVSSMKLHRDLAITQKSAWFMAQRLREAWNSESFIMNGPVEADEAFFGGSESNKHASKKSKAGRGTVNKTIVAGIKDRGTNEIQTQVVPDTSKLTLKGFVMQRTADGAVVYTDAASGYKGLPNREHQTVKHSVGEYVRGQAHTNGIESFWSLFSRGYDGTFHQLSPKHLHRYVAEFAGRHNMRDNDTFTMMGMMAARMVGKRLMYRDLIG